MNTAGEGRPPGGGSALLNLAGLALALLAGAVALSGRLYPHGDGREYVVQTQTIALEGRLAVDPARAAARWNRTVPSGWMRLEAAGSPAALLQMEPGLPGLYGDRRGGFRYYHFWLYPLAVAPVYLLGRLIAGDGGALESFRLVNLLFLALPFVIAWRKRPSWPLLGLMALACVSPLFAYVDWPHPELLCFGLVASAFLLADRPDWRAWAPLGIGLAACQNAPILLFLPAHAAWALGRERPVSRGEAAKAAAGYLGAALVALAPLLYFRQVFGVANPIQAVGLASLDYATAVRALDLAANPFTGALWFFPAAFLFFAAGLERRTLPGAIAVLVAAAAAAYLCGATRNFNAGQVGAPRYAVWLTAPLLAVALGRPWTEGGLRLRWGAAACLTLVVVFACGTLPLLLKRTGAFEPTSRLTRTTSRVVSLTGYVGDPEVFAENVLGRELPAPSHFEGVYVWNFAPGRSLWLVSGRSPRRLATLRWPRSSLPPYRTDPPFRALVLGQDGVQFDVAAVGRWRAHAVLGPHLFAWVEAGAEGLRGKVPIKVAGRP